MPRFEFVEGSSSKFWEIDLSGNTFTVRYGKIGTDGQTSTKVYGSDAEAKKEADKLTASKVKKGYSEVAGVEREADASDNPALEQELIDNPESKEGWLVYADFLMGNDDPRGALVAAYANGKKTDKLHEDHKKAFMGRFAGDMEPYTAFTWHMGFWKSARVFCDADTAEEMEEHEIKGIASVLGHVLRHPSGKFLQQLSIGLVEDFIDGEADWSNTIEAVVKSGVRPSLRELFIGDFERGDDTEISWTTVGNLGALWTILPNLRHLKAQGCNVELGKITAPNLESIRLWSGGLPSEPAKQIGSASLPKLTHLELWFGSEDYGAETTVKDLGKIFDGKGLPALTFLGLMNGEFADELPAALAKAKILPQLKVLDLSMGMMTDVGGRALVSDAKKFAHLERINLNENAISKAVVAEIMAALPNAQVEDQNDDDDNYVSVGE